MTAQPSLDTELSGEIHGRPGQGSSEQSEVEKAKYPEFVVKSVFLAWWLLLLPRCPAMALLEIGAQNTE